MDELAGTESRQHVYRPTSGRLPDSPVRATRQSGEGLKSGNMPDSPVTFTGQSDDNQKLGYLSNSHVIEEFRDLDKLG